ncbi:MAG: hypothetical protein RSA29_14495 [Clostridium sp.]|uniref:hypothetical protein n=1 Tax=Clostridium sp. TaxID=1506 RepID=UPI003217A51E
MKKIAIININNEITVRNQYDNEFIEKTEKCLQDINCIISFTDKFSTFNKAFEEFDKFLKKFESNQVSNNEFISEIELKINNVLSSGYKYIENVKTYFSRKLGAGSVEFYTFQLSKMYEKSFSYRLIYNIRNYTQHCGKPFHNLEKSTDEYKLVLFKDIFLEEHKSIQPSFKKELHALNENIYDIKNHLYNYFLNLAEFDKICVDYCSEINFKENIKSAFFITDNFKLLDDKYNYFIINNLPNGQQDKLNLKLQYVNYKGSLYILNKYIREFRQHGYAFPCFNESFPQVINVDTLAEIPQIIEGSDIVFEKNIMWKCIRKTVPFALGNYYSVYINNYIKEELKQILNQIIKDRTI